MQQKMIKNQRDYSICCRPGSSWWHHSRLWCKGWYVMVNLEVASCSIFQDNRDQIFPDAEVISGADGSKATCIRPEAAEDVISGYNVETFWDYCTIMWICELLASAVFKKIKIGHLYKALITVRPFGSHFLGQEAKMSNDLHNSKCNTWSIIYKTVNLSKSVQAFPRNRDSSMTQNLRLCDLLPPRSRFLTSFSVEM